MGKSTEQHGSSTGILMEKHKCTLSQTALLNWTASRMVWLCGSVVLSETALLRLTASHPEFPS